MTCELCLLEKRTRWYFENSEFVIIECKICRIPMCVWKHHGGTPSQKIITEMKKKSKEIFGSNITFRLAMRKLPGHCYFHVQM